MEPASWLVHVYITLPQYGSAWGDSLRVANMASNYAVYNHKVSMEIKHNCFYGNNIHGDVHVHRDKLIIDHGQVASAVW